MDKEFITDNGNLIYIWDVNANTPYWRPVGTGSVGPSRRKGSFEVAVNILEHNNSGTYNYMLKDQIRLSKSKLPSDVKISSQHSEKTKYFKGFITELNTSIAYIESVPNSLSNEFIAP